MEVRILELKRELKPMNFMRVWMIHGSNLGKEICCLEENKSFQPSLVAGLALVKRLDT